MRLKCIKLAGFKSFVDPTTVTFPSNLSAVVGPNGCGKSNIIDAVRWVMGESSAKNLRGESMTDVIFNGSGGRKPVGQASIELVFDNSDGSLKGEYAGFSEISIRRKVTRESQNFYYLNGTKCRRRDITDIFLGTGLGPRSYAIIEQGMISRLIEAKPEELRVFIEEAAGISKYKERRRDTENRMRRTKENLERLTDIRDELERQLSRLERQAQAAEKYTVFKAEERQLKAQIQVLNHQDLSRQADAKKTTITELELNVEAQVTEQLQCDSAIERHRSQYTELGDSLNEVQGRFYAIGGEIGKLEQGIQHAQERERQLQSDYDQAQRDLAEAQSHSLTDKDKAESWREELITIEPELEMIQTAQEESAEALEVAEESMQQWQDQWEQFNQKASEARQKAEVEQSRIQHLEQTQSRLLERIRRLDEEQQALGSDDEEDSIAELEEQLSEIELLLEEKHHSIESFAESIEEYRTTSKASEETLNSLRGDLQKQRGRQSSLEALQQAALGDSKGPVSEWLERQGIASNQRLAETITVTEGWEKAVETVLGDSLQAVSVDSLQSVSETLAELTKGELVLFEDGSLDRTSQSGETLADKITGPGAAQALLGNVLIASDLGDAMAKRNGIGPDQSLITPEGIWIGPNWLRVSKDKDAQSGVIARQQELETLSEQIANNESEEAELLEKVAALSEKLSDAERQRETIRADIDGLNARQNKLSSSLSEQRARIAQQLDRKASLRNDIAESKEQMELEAESLSEARMTLQDAIDAMQEDSDNREALLEKRDDIRVRLDDARQRARHDRDRSHELEMRFQSLKTQLVALESAQQRLQDQTERLVERKEQLQLSMEENREPAEERKLELEALLEKRIGVEDELSNARKQVEQVEHDLRNTEQKRNQIDQNIQKLRAALESERMAVQGFTVKCEAIVKQLREDQQDLDEVSETLPEDATESGLGTALEKVQNRITRLGPINLAAIDEYKIESERKTYLDAQNDELLDALETLENAIKKIDKETRNRFKETFDQVNGGLQELFPKVFGGGNAYLELTGDDMLDTGIAIMARPPGKRNSTIHLLSGGEKALTAIALVFSIFRLNPAPFCMLDEVDAPLDDANVGRYARMVEEMSSQVQFIYITHNKIAMEMAHQLLGVTMHEAGVSRLVTVDVEEAAEMAAM